jgi:hypothetical protein
MTTIRSASELVLHTHDAIKRYRVVLAISIALNMAVGVFILVAPEAFARLLGQPDPFPRTWPSHWGAQLLAINLLYLPGYWAPRENRWTNWLGVCIRFGFALFFFVQGDGFTPMGIYDGLSGVALLLTYLPIARGTRVQAR